MTQTMFCYQCEQTAGGQGCTRGGVCGKTPETAALHDLLIHQLKGIGWYARALTDGGQPLPDGLGRFVAYSAFSTLTNVNFDPSRFVDLLRESARLKDQLAAAANAADAPAACAYQLPTDPAQMLADAACVGVQSDPSLDPDVRALRELLIYGLKGMAAYAHHAGLLDAFDPAVDSALCRGFAAAADENQTVDGLVAEVMAVGRANLSCMELLDRANTGAFGDPEPTSALVSKKRGPFIVVSGHDLHDLRMILEQTAGRGVNVYTHGEMLPALAYPELKRWPQLVGNYGGAWYSQARDFDGIPGCVVMTTNCLQRPRPSYADRIFTTGPVGWPDMPHIAEHDGRKDFSPAIDRAIELGGWPEDEPERRIQIGFGHAAILSHAEPLIAAIKNGDIRRLFLVGGCDGARPARKYYTDLGSEIPDDCLILTLGCGKYRLHGRDFGTVAGLPRLLDLGQCNDAYSAIRVASALATEFNCTVNDLPLTLILAWYEQKAVAILLSLLALGVNNIRLGPTLPAFLTPNVLGLLVEKFNLAPTSSPADDLTAVLG